LSGWISGSTTSWLYTIISFSSKVTLLFSEQEFFVKLHRKTQSLQVLFSILQVLISSVLCWYASTNHQSFTFSPRGVVQGISKSITAGVGFCMTMVVRLSPLIHKILFNELKKMFFIKTDNTKALSNVKSAQSKTKISFSLFSETTGIALFSVFTIHQIVKIIPLLPSFKLIVGNQLLL